jgi:anti-anti-sigma regulatory factor
MFSTVRNLVVERVNRDVFIARLVTPDLREFLDCLGGSCELFQELRATVLDALEEGQTLVLNLGLIEPFPSAFYSWLLKVREAMLARRSRLVLCRLGPSIQEALDLFKGQRLFHIVRTEGQAIGEVMAGADRYYTRRSQG